MCDSEQLNFFGNDEAECTTSRYEKICRDVCDKFHYPTNAINFVKSENVLEKAKYFLRIDTFPLCSINLKKGIELQFNEKYLNKYSIEKSDVLNSRITERKSKNEIIRSYVVMVAAECSSFDEYFSYVIERIAANYTPSETFSCCGKYVLCSDARRCLHDDVLHSKGCQYRKNLENGRIFYGINAVEV